MAAVRRNSEVADLVRRLERSTQQVTASLDMFRPWHDETSELQIGPGLEPLQSALLHQFVAEPTESKSFLVAAEVWAGYHAKTYIRDA
jgi:hypothetical protein